MYTQYTVIFRQVTEVSLKPVLEDTDFKKTVKLTWLADVPENIPAVAVHYDNIISKAVLGNFRSLFLVLHTVMVKWMISLYKFIFNAYLRCIGKLLHQKYNRKVG